MHGENMIREYFIREKCFILFMVAVVLAMVGLGGFTVAEQKHEASERKVAWENWTRERESETKQRILLREELKRGYRAGFTDGIRATVRGNHLRSAKLEMSVGMRKALDSTVP